MNELQVYPADIGTTPADIFAALDVSEATRDEYTRRIQIFLMWVGGQTLNRDTFLDFKRYLAARNDLSASTKAKYLVAAKVFLRELYRRGALPVDITAGIRGFSQGKRHKRDGLNDVEIAKLTASLRELPDSLEADRLKAIFGLLVFQGLRQIEIVRLDVTDLQLSRGVAFVRGKGHDDTEPIYLHPQTIKALKSYLASNKLADGPLFVSRSNHANGERLTTRSLRRFVRDVLDGLDIEDKSTHGFRHNFTTRLIKEYKGDLLMVRQYTRHADVSTLMVYNDAVNAEADLPRFVGAFAGVEL